MIINTKSTGTISSDGVNFVPELTSPSGEIVSVLSYYTFESMLNDLNITYYSNSSYDLTLLTCFSTEPLADEIRENVNSVSYFIRLRFSDFFVFHCCKLRFNFSKLINYSI